MLQNFKKFAVIVAFCLIPTLLIWLPFFFRLPSFWRIPLPSSGMATIVSNYDGPLFLVVAKTFYDQGLIESNFQFPLPTEYYAAHLPLFPILIKIFSFAAGFPYAMLLVTLASSVLAAYFFNKFISQYMGEKNALFATLVFSIFPARWLIVRSVGSAEPLFVAAIIASVYFFQNKKYLYAGLWGMVAGLTKSPAIILFAAFAGAYFSPKIKLAIASHKSLSHAISFKEIWPIALIPLSLVAVFAFYQIRMNDFFAYFHSGDNIHLTFPPFSIFNYSAPWVGTFWLEEIILVYLFGILGLLRLIKQKDHVLSWFVGLFFFSLIFVSHRDIIRYTLPITPFLFKAFSDELVSKEFKIAIYVLIIPIYLFSLAYISQNVMPIANWGPFL